MNKEFKKGDLVLVRSSDLREWVDAILIEVDESLLDAPFLVELTETTKGYYCQCRHIDDFRTHDKVQVRSGMNEEWEDAVYGCYVPHDSFEHWVYSENEDDLTCHKLCRWHPSMPWAEKEEPLTLEQRVEALERKLNETFNTKER